MKKRKNLLIVLITIFTASVFPGDTTLLFQDAVDHLSRDEQNTLLKEGELTFYHEDLFSPILIPDGSWKQRISSGIGEKQLNLAIEGLFLFKDFDLESFENDPETSLVKLYNRLQAVSTLEGIEYYSASRKKMRVLFEESRRIPDLDQPKNSLDDNISGNLPGEEFFYVHQKDTTFGNSESLMTLYYDEPVISTVLVNQTDIRFKILKVIDKEKLEIHLVILPTDEGLLFYAVMGADTLKIKKFREIAHRSFENRIKALYAWYVDDLNL